MRSYSFIDTFTLDICVEMLNEVLIRPLIKIFLMILVVVAIPLSSFGAKYKGAFIKAKADSVLKKVLGDSIFHKHIKYLRGNYTFDSWDGSTNHGDLYLRNRVLGKPEYFSLDYIFHLPEHSSFAHPINIYIDRELQVIYDGSSDFVPKYIKNNKPSEFLSATAAGEIATPLFKYSLDSTNLNYSASLVYDEKRRIFTWKVTRAIKVDQYDGEYELIVLDAKSGKVVEQLKYYTETIICPTGNQYDLSNIYGTIIDVP